VEWAFGGRKEDRFAICDLGTNEVALTVSQRRWVCQASAVAQRWRSGAVARSLFVRAFVRWFVALVRSFVGTCSFVGTR